MHLFLISIVFFTAPLAAFALDVVDSPGPFPPLSATLCTGDAYHVSGVCTPKTECNFVQQDVAIGVCAPDEYCCSTQPLPTGGSVQKGTTNTNPPIQKGTVNTGNTNPGTSITLINPLGTGATLSSFLTSILDLVIQIGSVVVILMLVYVGFLFVVARGEPAAITKARQALLWTVVGALILLGAQAIAKGIEATVQALSVGK